MLMCTSCAGLSSLKCPDCLGNGRIRQTLSVSAENASILDGVSCLSCASTGTVHCSVCIGIGAMRCCDCRGLGHIKCDCNIQAGYAKDRL